MICSPIWSRRWLPAEAKETRDGMIKLLAGRPAMGALPAPACDQGVLASITTSKAPC